METQVLAEGLRGLGQGAEVDAVMAGELTRQRSRFERRLMFLGTLFIEKRSPICAAVSRLPNPAGNRAEIISVRLTHNTFDRQRAPTAKRTDLPPMHAVEQLFIDCSGRRRGRGTSGLNRSW